MFSLGNANFFLSLSLVDMVVVPTHPAHSMQFIIFLKLVQWYIEALQVLADAL